MSPHFFELQVQRLITRFGQKNFDPEFCKLVWSETHDMSEAGFKRFCDVLIGSRTQNKPPLLSEFREARLNEQKVRFENDLRGATNLLKRRAPQEMREHLREVLRKEVGAVESIVEALEVVKLRRQVERANDKDPA